MPPEQPAIQPVGDELSVATKLVPTTLTLDRLKTAGRAAADRFLEDSFDDIGTRDSVDLAEMFG